jgi:predicted esterase
MRWTLCIAAALLAAPVWAGGDPPADPRADLRSAPTGTVLSVTSAVRSLDHEGQPLDDFVRYSFSLPEGFDGAPRDLVIICHGLGLDHRWGLAANPHGVFRPGDIVVAVDGTRENLDGTRTWGPSALDTSAFRDLTLELSRTFPTRRIYLYGHSQGAFFVLAAGSHFPRLYNGVLVHAGGVLNSTRIGPAQRGMPVAFLHGSEDYVAPLRWGIDARDALMAENFRVLSMRRVYGLSHDPAPAHAHMGIDWLVAMTTPDGAEALRLARALLMPPAGLTPAFGQAAQVLARFDLPDEKGAWPRGFAGLTDAQRAQARALSVSLEALGLRHAGALRAQVPDDAWARVLRRVPLEPDEKRPEWLGHLLALREDFRHVASVEAFIADIGFDAAQAAHDARARTMMQAYVEQTPRAAFAEVLRLLPECALFEGLPPDMPGELLEWGRHAATYNLREQDARLTGLIRQWQGALSAGRKRYEQINAGWSAPGE